jgi:hypothetical protein
VKGSYDQVIKVWEWYKLRNYPKLCACKNWFVTFVHETFSMVWYSLWYLNGMFLGFYASAGHLKIENKLENIFLMGSIRGPDGVNR